jgi:hypothetical protein
MKIALLFLTMDNVYFPEIWKYYLKNNKGKYTIYCHPKYPNDVTVDWMKQNIIKKLVPTKWGHFTNAYVELMREALKDKQNTKFILLSESCLPIKSFDSLYNFVYDFPIETSFIDLQEMDMYNINKSKLPSNYLSNISFIKHSGWFCLSRHHVKKLLHKSDVFKFNKIIAGDEHILSLIYKSTSNNYINYPITYANWEYTTNKINELNEKLKKLYEYQESTGKSQSNKINELRKQKGIIGKHPYTYSNITTENLNIMKNSKSFFQRKFSNTSNIIDYYKQLINN